MKDVYFMNKETGEILPGTEAIREFYRNHGILEAWTDEWEETKLEVEGTELAAPDFTRILN